jgi:hypothetical protein
LKAQLEQEARSSQQLILWLDCDREGEAISMEVAEVCKAVNPNIQIKRARFTALIPQYGLSPQPKARLPSYFELDSSQRPRGRCCPGPAGA